MTGLDARAREAAEGLDAAGVAYLAKVRQAAGRLARRDVAPDDVHAALADLQDRSSVDVDVPTLSRRRSLQVVKGTVKTLSAWYLRYLSEQVTSFGAATVRFGEAMVQRTDALERSTDALASEVAQLGARLERLEGRDPGVAADRVPRGR